MKQTFCIFDISGSSNRPIDPDKPIRYEVTIDVDPSDTDEDVSRKIQAATKAIGRGSP